MKPRLFIGSSSQRLPIARALKELLAESAEVTVWDEAREFAVGRLHPRFVDQGVKSLRLRPADFRPGRLHDDGRRRDRVRARQRHLRAGPVHGPHGQGSGGLVDGSRREGPAEIERPRGNRPPGVRRRRERRPGVDSRVADGDLRQASRAHHRSRIPHRSNRPHRADEAGAVPGVFAIHAGAFPGRHSSTFTRSSRSARSRTSRV